MATIATMAMLKPAAPSSSGSVNKARNVSLRSLHKRAGGLAIGASPAAASALAGAFFSALASSDAALAAQQIADAADDNRGTLLLLVVAPAVGWVLYNILQPALNQLNRMRGSQQAAVAGLGLGATAAGMAWAPEASAAAQEVVAAGDDNRGTLLLLVVAPAIGWVLYNILQPALNQLNRMRND
jgi:photosystem II PsbY protein